MAKVAIAELLDSARNERKAALDEKFMAEAYLRRIEQEGDINQLSHARFRLKQAEEKYEKACKQVQELVRRRGARRR